MCVFYRKCAFHFYSFLLYGSLLQKNMSLYIARKTYREKCICFSAKMEEILKKLFLPFVFNAFFRFALLAKQPTHICLAFILRVKLKGITQICGGRRVESSVKFPSQKT